MNNPNKPSCFVSYCHKDTDRNTLNFIIKQIQHQSSNGINFLLDLNVDYGTSWADFMAKIKDVDVLLVILTPSYKQRVAKREGSVYLEYQYILEKLEENKTARNVDGEQNLPPLKVLPILLTGTRKTAVPPALQDLRHVDLTKLVVRKKANGETFAPDHIRLRYVHIFRKIATQLIVHDILSKEQYQTRLDEFYDKLFIKVKHSPLAASLDRNYRDVLVQTAAYKKVERQECFFVIGRKGTGKSTLTSMLQILHNKRYNGHINIRADNINLQMSYDSLSKGRWSDIEGVLKPLDYFQLGWQGFIILAMIDLLIKRDKKKELTAAQRKLMTPLRSFHKTQFPNHGENLQTAMFAYATSKLSVFLEEQISHSGGADFADLVGKVISAFNSPAYLDFLIGSNAISALERIVSLCQKRILITLDDFDSVFDAFRKRATDDSEKRSRAKIESDWLRALLLLTSRIKTNQPFEHGFFHSSDFCLTIPQDRFTEIERSDRDGYIYNLSAASILWSGSELCELLVKRFEKMCNYSCEERSVKDRLAEILRIHWPEIPHTIEFSFNGFPISIPTFLYVLRHTFWRPRDILLYFGNILAAARDIRDRGERIDSEVIRRIISETTYQIIKTEFLDEYSSAIWNLRHVINQFTNLPQSPTFESVEEKLRSCHFGVAIESEDALDLDRKIELLYEIGFLGVQLDARIRSSLNVSADCFYFNEGRMPLRAFRKEGYRSGKFVIHPIFSENLLLDYTKNDFILNLDWDYISRSHQVIVAAGKAW